MKAILFGSIGTLIETSNIQRESFNQAFKEIGLDWYWDQESYKQLLKKSGGTKRIEDFAEKNNTNVDAKKIRERKTLIYNEKLRSCITLPREGVLDVIQYARKHNIKKGLVTSTTTENIDSVFETLNKKIIREDFDFIGNNSLIKMPKPEPDIYLKAVNDLKIHPSECIAIEDSVESSLSAYKAKIKCVAFPGLFHIDDDFSLCIKSYEKLDISVFK
jgi:HAD superfamily hydrolase (TIGR01509 family)